MTRTTAIQLLTTRYHTMRRTHPQQVTITLQQFIVRNLDEALAIKELS